MPLTIYRLQQLVGNQRLYAEQRPDGSWFPVERPLSRAVLHDHMKGKRTVGTYVLDEDKARTLVFDLDGVVEGDYGPPSAIVDSLKELGVPQRSIGVEWSGRKGYHVWVLLGSYVLAKELRRVGRAVLALAEVECEVFPKQDRATKYGNLVKLPGGVHRVSGRPNHFVIEPSRGWGLPQPLSVAHLKRVLADLPPEPDVRTSEGPPPVLECLHRIQEGVAEGGRNHSMYHLAVMLRRGGLADEYVDVVVHQVAEERCDPPLPTGEVNTLLESSKQGGPVCHQLPESVRCKECPIKRPKGLYTKPGQLRHGAEGELAVVELGHRKAGRKTVELKHPDITDGMVAII